LKKFLLTDALILVFHVPPSGRDRTKPTIRYGPHLILCTTHVNL